jgi:pimeloyl-ACP methyl ester carboxylesterase
MNPRARSADGTELAVYEIGVQDGPVLVAVHGYPDDHTVWDGVAAALADTFRVITYDVRGAGASDVPADKSGYRMARLVDDLVAVLDAAAPGRPVHLLAHDWGSIQCWPALTDPRLAGRIATFTSVSGPSLDHASAWLRASRAHPRAALRQLAHSYYTLLFKAPKLPELAIRAGLVDRAVGRRRRADEVNGLYLYRANMLSKHGRTAAGHIDIPVQVLAPADDPFVTPELATGAPAPFVRELHTRVVPGEHWLVSERPEVIADAVRSFVS